MKPGHGNCDTGCSSAWTGDDKRNEVETKLDRNKRWQKWQKKKLKTGFWKIYLNHLFKPIYLL
jgi:hypothetical protein